MPLTPRTYRQRRAELLHILGDCRCGAPAKHIWTRPGGRGVTDWVQRARWRWVLAWRELEPLCDRCSSARWSATHLQRGRPHGGTRTGYNRGCRCRECQAAARVAMRKYRAKLARK